MITYYASPVKHELEKEKYEIESGGGKAFSLKGKTEVKSIYIYTKNIKFKLVIWIYARSLAIFHSNINFLLLYRRIVKTDVSSFFSLENP